MNKANNVLLGSLVGVLEVIRDPFAVGRLAER